jgi:hypothetical protein
MQKWIETQLGSADVFWKERTAGYSDAMKPRQPDKKQLDEFRNQLSPGVHSGVVALKRNGHFCMLTIEGDDWSLKSMKGNEVKRFSINWNMGNFHEVVDKAPGGQTCKIELQGELYVQVPGQPLESDCGAITVKTAISQMRSDCLHIDFFRIKSIGGIFGSRFKYYKDQLQLLKRLLQGQNSQFSVVPYFEFQLSGGSLHSIPRNYTPSIFHNAPVKYPLQTGCGFDEFYQKLLLWADELGVEGFVITADLNEAVKLIPKDFGVCRINNQIKCKRLFEGNFAFNSSDRTLKQDDMKVVGYVQGNDRYGYHYSTLFDQARSKVHVRFTWISADDHNPKMEGIKFINISDKLPPDTPLDNIFKIRDTISNWSSVQTQIGNYNRWISQNPYAVAPREPAAVPEAVVEVVDAAQKEREEKEKLIAAQKKWEAENLFEWQGNKLFRNGQELTPTIRQIWKAQYKAKGFPFSEPIDVAPPPVSSVTNEEEIWTDTFQGNDVVMRAKNSKNEGYWDMPAGGSFPVWHKMMVDQMFKKIKDPQQKQYRLNQHQIKRKREFAEATFPGYTKDEIGAVIARWGRAEEESRKRKIEEIAARNPVPRRERNKKPVPSVGDGGMPVDETYFRATPVTQAKKKPPFERAPTDPIVIDDDATQRYDSDHEVMAEEEGNDATQKYDPGPVVSVEEDRTMALEELVCPIKLTWKDLPGVYDVVGNGHVERTVEAFVENVLDRIVSFWSKRYDVSVDNFKRCVQAAKRDTGFVSKAEEANRANMIDRRDKFQAAVNEVFLKAQEYLFADDAKIYYHKDENMGGASAASAPVVKVETPTVPTQRPKRKAAAFLTDDEEEEFRNKGSGGMGEQIFDVLHLLSVRISHLELSL